MADGRCSRGQVGALGDAHHFAATHDDKDSVRHELDGVVDIAQEAPALLHDPGIAGVNQGLADVLVRINAVVLDQGHRANPFAVAELPPYIRLVTRGRFAEAYIMSMAHRTPRASSSVHENSSWAFTSASASASTSSRVL